jgi:hypothetical protein
VIASVKLALGLLAVLSVVPDAQEPHSGPARARLAFSAAQSVAPLPVDNSEFIGLALRATVIAAMVAFGDGALGAGTVTTTLA